MLYSFGSLRCFKQLGGIHESNLSQEFSSSTHNSLQNLCQVLEQLLRRQFMQRVNYSSGSPLEELAGYSRMVKIGDRVIIGGTTAVQPDGTVFGTTAYEQAQYVFGKFIELLKRAGAEAKDVYKVKAYVTDMSLAMDVAKAYSEYFKEVRPLFTMVETPKLNRPSQLVEIELEAMIGCEVFA
jgi:enamine deaminase RidA (YjgF/YER057c/UK114 family)